MQAIILAGGFGTRLSEETDVIPKPMIEVGGNPILWHIMKIFSFYGINQFTVALGYKGEVIKDYFTRYYHLKSDLRVELASGMIKTKKTLNEDWTINLIDTGQNSMTGGRLKRLAEQIDSTFIFTYGDGLSNIDIHELVAFHRSHKKLATVTAVKPRQRFGLLKVTNDGEVSQFSEKPEADGSLINGGFFVLEPEVLDYIKDDSTVWEKEPCENLVKDKQLMAYHHDGYWQCVDTLHELRILRQLWNAGEAEWKLW